MEVCGLGDEAKESSPGKPDTHPAEEAAAQQHSFWHSGLNTAVRPGSEPATEGNGKKSVCVVGIKFHVVGKIVGEERDPLPIVARLSPRSLLFRGYVTVLLVHFDLFLQTPRRSSSGYSWDAQRASRVTGREWTFAFSLRRRATVDSSGAWATLSGNRTKSLRCKRYLILYYFEVRNTKSIIHGAFIPTTDYRYDSIVAFSSTTYYK